MRKQLFIGALFVFFLLFCWSVHKKETLLADGDLLIFKTAPVDPRSLMQGDYMILRFQIEGDIREARDPQEKPFPYKDRAIVQVDPKTHLATFVRLDRGEPLAKGEHPLVFRQKGRPTISSGSFFFQEGHGQIYAAARFVGTRVSKEGEILLTHLLDTDMQRIVPPAPKKMELLTPPLLEDPQAEPAMPDEVPDQMSGDFSDEMPMDDHDHDLPDMPDRADPKNIEGTASPEMAPGVSPETAPDASPEVNGGKNGTAKTAPEMVPGVSPETAPDASPEMNGGKNGTAKTAPEMAPGVSPETAPDASPEVNGGKNGTAKTAPGDKPEAATTAGEDSTKTGSAEADPANALPENALPGSALPENTLPGSAEKSPLDPEKPNLGETDPAETTPVHTDPAETSGAVPQCKKRSAYHT